MSKTNNKETNWSINDTSSLLSNKHYKAFYTKKQRIKSKYPSLLFKQYTTRPPKQDKDWYKEEGQLYWRKYCKEVADLIFEQNGDFQEFTWDIISENDRLLMERKARGRKRHYDYK
jgi:hypothetical protein